MRPPLLEEPPGSLVPELGIQARTRAALRTDRHASGRALLGTGKSLVTKNWTKVIELVRDRSGCRNDLGLRELQRRRVGPDDAACKARSAPSMQPAGRLRMLRHSALVGLLFCLAIPQLAQSQDAREVPSNWSLVPSGLSVGDSFRLLFVSTSERDATSADIADYDTHVQTAAASSDADIGSHSTHFRVLGSTATVDARDHTSTTFTMTEPGVPIYWLGGTAQDGKVADDYSDFYDTDGWDSNVPRDEDGNTVSTAEEVFTGSLRTGVKHAERHLGRSTGAPVQIAEPGTATNEIEGSRGRPKDSSQPFYGLSGVFTVVDPPRPPVVNVSLDWGLVPSGLSVGDSFRLLFVSTSERDATSADIADYDTHIQSAAGGGHLDVRPYSTHFRVLGSTATVDARDHTITHLAAPELDVPIYWLGGAKVADDYSDLYDTAGWDSNVPRGEDGNTVATDEEVFTGSLRTGLKHAERHLGRSTGAPVQIAEPGTATNEIEGSRGRPKDTSQPFYGLSFVFTVVESPRPPAVNVPSNWPLVPSGLSVGDSFRLLFVSSSERDATSAAIADYDTHVHNAAAGGHVEIRSYSTHFRVLGSTATVDARDHTITGFTVPELDVPIYWLGGAKVADDYSDFYDDDGWDSNVPRDEGGNLVNTSEEVFTGSLRSGVKDGDRHLGRSSGDPVRIAEPGTATNEIQGSRNRAKNTSQPFYGLSLVFTVVEPPPPQMVPTLNVLPSWGLAPSDLSEGDSFRLLFVTSTTTGAKPPEIEGYDTHVQAAAASGHADIQELSTHFRVLGSNSMVDARDHTVTSSTATPDVPIYWLGGARVADDYSDFYDGAWDSNAPRDEFGTQVATDLEVFTGSNSNGTKFPNRFFGADDSVRVGVPGISGGELDSRNRARTTQLPFYGLSGVFTLSLRAGLQNRASIRLGPSMVREDDGVTQVVVTVTLDESESQETELAIQVRDDTAVSPDDFTAQPRTLRITVPPGQLEGTGSFTLTPVREQQGEPECGETITITGVPAVTSSVTAVTVGRASLMLSDPDADDRRCAPPLDRSAVTAKAESRPDPPREQSPGPGVSTAPSAPPSEAKLAIWTDRLGYSDGEPLRLYRTLDPMGDERDYTFFYYLENIGTGRRHYFAPGIRSTTLEDDVVDHLGLSAGAIQASRIDAVTGELIWAGAMPDAGPWHFVAELRSPDAREVLKAAYAKFTVAENAPRVYQGGQGETIVAADQTWTSSTVHKVRQPVRVRAGATLTVEAGTLIQGLGANARIIVEQGGRIEAVGSQALPIVMTCDRDVGRREPGCWGGLAVMGSAPAGTGDGEASQEYGGDDPDDSSGELRFVRVEFAGAGQDSSAPQTALALYGVGSGTVLDRVQVHESLGDGIEFRGGTAHCRYCVSSGSRDDSLEWSGWQGTAQHLFLQQGSVGDSGIEASGAGSGSAGPVLRNATLVGGSIQGMGAFSGVGIELGEGAVIGARNLVVTGFGREAITAESETAALFVDAQSSIGNTILYENGGRFGVAQTAEAVTPYIEFVDEDPALRNARYEANPDPRPKAGSVALDEDSAADAPSDEALWTNARYLGAFGSTNWLTEWTFFGPESEYQVPEPEETEP